MSDLTDAMTARSSTTGVLVCGCERGGKRGQMASGRFRRFTKVERLEEVGRPLLKRLFAIPVYAEAFKSTGVVLPEDSLADADYYKAVAALFRNGDSLPDSVSDDLHLIDELAGIQEMDDVRERFREQGRDLPVGARTVMEVVVELWLLDATLVKAVHFDMVLHRLTGYEQFEPRTKPGSAYVYPGDAVLAAMRPALSDWFDRHDRGPDVIIEHYLMDGEHWFIIKHNEPVDVVRELKGGLERSFRVHPRKDDVVVYSPLTGGIRINARSGRERALYREAFGFHLFGAPDHFLDGSAYTLAPLAAKGEDALKLVPGIRRVVLKELRFHRWGEPSTTETQKGENVFESFKSRKFVMREDTAIYHAVFDVTFGGEDDLADPKPRKFKVSRGNRVQIARNCDHAIFDRWLRENEYVQANAKKKRTRKKRVEGSGGDAGSIGASV